MAEQACAVVVTYHPDQMVEENLRRLKTQLRSVIVVDNGSDERELAALRGVCEREAIELVANHKNMGIAAALNQGARWALDNAFRYVFLFDQDSTVSEGFVEAMLHCLHSDPRGSHLAILVPRYKDSRSGLILEPHGQTNGELDAATTSGSLMPVAVFEKAGLFAEELFVDGVDYEYSLRVRSLGLVIRECPGAVLLHSPGTPTSHRLGNFKPFLSANYSPVRRYYQERNKLWVARRYWRRYPRFLFGQFLISAKDFAKILLVEKNRSRKVKFFLRGLWDGFLGRSGPFTG